VVIRIGDVGRALSALSPSGVIEIDGVRLDARSDGTFIEAGGMVVVLRGDPTGYVVRKHVPGSPPLPNHGEPVRKGEFQLSGTEVAAAENEAERLRRAEVRAEMKRGSVRSAVVGALLGAASAGLGWHFNWADGAESVGLALLVLYSAAAGALTGVVLYFFSGVFVARVLPAEEGVWFSPSFLAVLFGLLGAALGFWLKFDEAGVAVALGWSAGLGLAFAALTAGLAWTIGLT